MVAGRSLLQIETLADVRAEVARRKLSQGQVAAAMGRTAQSLSHLMSWEDDVRLTEAGARRFAAAITACGAEEASA